MKYKVIYYGRDGRREYEKEYRTIEDALKYRAVWIEAKKETRPGYYPTVWKKDPDGTWRRLSGY